MICTTRKAQEARRKKHVNTCCKLADVAVKRFVKDLGKHHGIEASYSRCEGQGDILDAEWPMVYYTLTAEGKHGPLSLDLSIPPKPLNKLVWFEDGEYGGIGDRYRLLVDGSSWIWCFALSQAAHALIENCADCDSKNNLKPVELGYELGDKTWIWLLCPACAAKYDDDD